MPNNETLRTETYEGPMPTEFRSIVNERLMSDGHAPHNLKLKIEYFDEALDPNDNAKLGERVRSLPGIETEADALNNPDYQKYLESASTIYEVIVNSGEDYKKIEAFVDLCQAENITLESLMDVLGPGLSEDEYAQILESINTVREFAPELLTNKPEEYILEKQVTVNGQTMTMGGNYGAPHRLNPNVGSKFKYSPDFDTAHEAAVNAELSAAEEVDSGGTEPTPEELAASNEPLPESVDTVDSEIKAPTESMAEVPAEQQTQTQPETPTAVEPSKEYQETSNNLLSNIGQRKSSLNIRPGSQYSERTGEAIPPEPDPSSMSGEAYEQAAQEYLAFLEREEAVVARKRHEAQQRAQEIAKQKAANNKPGAAQSAVIGGSITRTNSVTGETETIRAPEGMAISMNSDGSYEFVPRNETVLAKAFTKGKEGRKDRNESNSDKLRGMLKAAYEVDTEGYGSGPDQDYSVEEKIEDYQAASAAIDALSQRKKEQNQVPEPQNTETPENNPEQ